MPAKSRIIGCEIIYNQRHKANGFGWEITSQLIFRMSANEHMMKIHRTTTSRKLLVALLIGFAFGSRNTPTHNRLPLFDGETLDARKVGGGEAAYTLEHGAIGRTMTAGTPNPFL